MVFGVVYSSVYYFIYKDAREEYEGLKAMQLYYKITTEYLLGKLDMGNYIKYNDRGNFVYLGSIDI